MFDTITTPMRSRGRRPLLLSLAAHSLLLAALLLVPLVFYDELAVRWVGDVFTEVKADPAPPPRPPAGIPAPSPRTSPARPAASPWAPPALVPDRIPYPEDEPGPAVEYPANDGLWTGGLAFPGGNVAPEAGWPVSGDGASTVPPPPPPPAVKQPLRVVGTILASKLIRRVEPEYPDLARRARVQGMVQLEIQIGTLGDVEEVRVISGHALLVGAAVAAVRQWKYSPTLLNGEPVPVTGVITVRFVLQ